MKTEGIITVITTKVKTFLHEHGDSLDLPLTGENAEIVANVIQTAVTTAAEGFKTYLQQNEIRENTVIR